MTLGTFTAEEIRRRPGRAMLTVLSVAIGMATIVAVSLGTATTQRAYRQMYGELVGRSSLQVSAEGGGTFDRSLAGKLVRLPGVRAAVPSL
jgi:putative ABC transport system permease protein